MVIQGDWKMSVTAGGKLLATSESWGITLQADTLEELNEDMKLATDAIKADRAEELNG